MFRYLIVLVLVLYLPPAAWAAISGQPCVIDGDTLEVAGQRIRLHGIDAPESRQLCRKDGESWRCGKDATSALKAFLGSHPVSCEELDRDRYRRVVAKCVVDGVDIGEWMVSRGWAVAYRGYSLDYVEQETGAQLARRGVWGTRFVLPWEWRLGRRLSQGVANDNPACRIKGNISRSGERIYHVPGGRWYERAIISPSKGERWFCSEEEAQAAGWRRAKQ